MPFWNFLGLLVSELGSSCLWGKHLNHWTLFPVPQCITALALCQVLHRLLCIVQWEGKKICLGCGAVVWWEAGARKVIHRKLKVMVQLCGWVPAVCWWRPGLHSRSTKGKARKQGSKERKVVMFSSSNGCSTSETAECCDGSKIWCRRRESWRSTILLHRGHIYNQVTDESLGPGG